MTLDARIQDPLTGERMALRNGVIPTYALRAPGFVLAPEDVRNMGPWSSQIGDDLNVDGSTTPQEFTVTSSQAEVILVKEVRLLFHAANAKLDSNEVRRFGPVAAPGLTNGLRVYSVQQGVESDLFVSPVKTMGDFFTYARAGASPVANIVDGVSAGVDIVVITIDLLAPVGLYPSSLDRLVVKVQDDLTGLALFNAFAFGERRAI